MARVTSDIFVSALMRTVRTRGGQAYLVRRGAKEAGAIFLAQRDAGTGLYHFYEPAPQSFGGDYRNDPEAEIGDGRVFSKRETLFSEADTAARYQSEAKFDPDFWIVEIEDLEADLSDLIKVV